MSAEPVEWSVEGFVRLDCHNLRGGRLASHRVLYPPLEPRPTGPLAGAYSGESGRRGSRPILGRRLPQEDAAGTRAEVRRPVNGERLDVEGSFLELGRVISNEGECAETDLVAQRQSTTENHVDED